MGMRKKTNAEGGLYEKKPESQGMSSEQKLAAAKMGLEAIKASQGSSGAEGSTDTASGVGEGALSGAATAAMVSGGNPYAVAAGAAVGGLTGGMQARSNRKAAERKAQAEHFNNLADIEQRKAQNMSNAIASMAAQMGASLRR